DESRRELECDRFHDRELLPSLAPTERLRATLEDGPHYPRLLGESTPHALVDAVPDARNGEEQGRAHFGQIAPDIGDGIAYRQGGADRGDPAWVVGGGVQVDHVLHAGQLQLVDE